MFGWLKKIIIGDPKKQESSWAITDVSQIAPGVNVIRYNGNVPPYQFDSIMAQQQSQAAASSLNIQAMNQAMRSVAAQGIATQQQLNRSQQILFDYYETMLKEKRRFETVRDFNKDLDALVEDDE